MAAPLASVALNGARGLLNDVSAQVYTDTMLIPSLQQAFWELQSILNQNAASLSRKITTGTVVTPAKIITISDMIEPIRIWERPAGSTDDAAWVLMTEYDPLPNVMPDTTLIYWQWDGTQINLIGSSVNRQYKINYRWDMPVPTGPSSSLVFIDAQVYLSPRTAALACQSLGQDKDYDRMNTIALSTIKIVVDANRGRNRAIYPVPGN